MTASEIVRMNASSATPRSNANSSTWDRAPTVPRHAPPGFARAPELAAFNLILGDRMVAPCLAPPPERLLLLLQHQCPASTHFPPPPHTSALPHPTPPP